MSDPMTHTYLYSYHWLLCKPRRIEELTGEERPRSHSRCTPHWLKFLAVSGASATVCIGAVRVNIYKLVQWRACTRVNRWLINFLAFSSGNSGLNSSMHRANLTMHIVDPRIELEKCTTGDGEAEGHGTAIGRPTSHWLIRHQSENRSSLYNSW